MTAAFLKRLLPIPALAVAVTAAALEELDLARGAILVEKMVRDGRHAALVLLAPAVDVEIAQAHDLRRALVPVGAHVLIEQELRVAVDVERALVGALFAKSRPRPVDRGRRGVEIRDLLVSAKIEQFAGIVVVVAHHVAAVDCGRVRASALVQDRAHRAVEAAVAEPLEKIILVEIIRDFAVDEIDELVAATQIIDGENLGLAALVERLDDVGPDETGGAGHYYVHILSSRMSKDEG